MIKDPSAFTTAIPRLYDQYTAAMANAYRPDLANARDKLNEIIAAAEKARDALNVMLVPIGPATLAEVISSERREKVAAEFAEQSKRATKAMG